MVSYLQVENLTKSFGDKILFENISFSLHEGQRMALIARNGAGKTSLLNILAGKDCGDIGKVTFRSNLRVSFLEQLPNLKGTTVWEACFESDNEIVQTIAQYERILQEQELNIDTLKNRAKEFEAILAKMDALGAWNFEARVKQILGKLGIYDLELVVKNLSGGQQKRIALANALITNPDLLILDEPTNHLDLEMVEWLEEFLCNSNLTLLVVTHDRYFLDRICDHIIEIDNQILYRYQGNYSYYLEKKELQLVNKVAEIKTINALYKRELEWIRRQPQARSKKSQSRIDAFKEIEKRAKQRIENRQLSLGLKSIYIGSKIFEVQYVSKSFGKLKILDNFYYNFSRYEKLGIIGKNGTGKSTFLKMILGEEPVDSGCFDIGETVRFGYFSQAGLVFDEQKKVIDVVREIAEVVDLGGGVKVTASQFLSRFLFDIEQQYNYVYKLSGGELRRLYLCTVLMQNPNFLILDEPTNDLDISSLNVLETYLSEFRGCLIVVSHDRFFMDKIVDHLLVFEGDAKIKDFPGNYTDYRHWCDLQKQGDNLIPNQKNRREENIINSPKLLERRKLSYKEKKELELIEKTLENLEQERSEIEYALASGNLMNEEILTKSNRFAELTKLIDEKTMRWFELSELG